MLMATLQFASFARSPTSSNNLLLSTAIGLCLLACGFFSQVVGQSSLPQSEDVIRVDTDVTNLFFIVSDKQKRYVTTLQEADLRVLEDGEPQKILVFQRETDR